jgi:hypothetical protein
MEVDVVFGWQDFAGSGIGAFGLAPFVGVQKLVRRQNTPCQSTWIKKRH